MCSAWLACLITQSCPTLCDPVDCSPPGFSVHEDSPGKNTGVGCHALLQRIFLTQGSNPYLLCLQHWRATSSPLELSDKLYHVYSWDSLVAQTVKNPLQCWRPGFNPWVGKIPWRRAWQPTPVFLPGESSWTEDPGELQSIGLQRVGPD